MGADNWAICPNCRVTAIKKQEKLCDKADAAYGKKPVEEFITLRDAANQPLKLEQTMREDYALGVGMDGEFGVSYRAHCKVCQFAFEFTHSEAAAKVPEEYQYDANSDDPYGYNFRK